MNNSKILFIDDEERSGSTVRFLKLVNNIDDKIYIGSTVNPLYKRKGQHKSTSILKPNIKLYQYLNEIGWDNVDIILIENFPCESKEVLHQRERYWIDILKPQLNTNIPTRTLKEYYEDNKENLKNYNEKYRKDNKDKIKIYQEHYRNNNKDKLYQICICNICNCNYTKQNKKQHEKSQKHLNNMNK